MRSRIGSGRPPHQSVTFWTGTKLGGFRLQFFREESQSIGKGNCLFETSPLLHGEAPSFDWAGAQAGDLVTDNCLRPSGDGENYGFLNVRARAIYLTLFRKLFNNRGNYSK